MRKLIFAIAVFLIFTADVDAKGGHHSFHVRIKKEIQESGRIMLVASYDNKKSKSASVTYLWSNGESASAIIIDTSDMSEGRYYSCVASYQYEDSSMEWLTGNVHTYTDKASDWVWIPKYKPVVSVSNADKADGHRTPTRSERIVILVIGGAMILCLVIIGIKS